MGKYIKYFENNNSFAEWYNFGEMPAGPDGAPVSFVAYVKGSNVYYTSSDMSGIEVLFEPVDPAIDATAETVTFNVKTGLFWLEVYHNGELIDEYAPGLDKHYDYSVDANITPLTVTENFVGKWYKEVPGVGDKGDYITEFQQPVTHLPDPNADPVKLQCYVGFNSDGQTPTRLGNGPLTGATRVYYEDNGSEIDILNDIYIQSKRAWYQFSAQGEYNVCFEFEDENQTVGDLFVYSQGTSLEIITNYPELAEQTNFMFNGPLMQSSISELMLGEGMQSVKSSAFMMANNLSHIVLEDPDKLPVVSGSFFGLPQTGVLECNEEAENFELWQAAIPSGWEINPGQGGGTVGKVTLEIYIDTSDNPYPIVGGGDVESEFAGEMELYDPNGNRVSSDNFGLYVDKEEHTRLDVQNAVDGTYTLILRRESDDLLLQGWLSGGEFQFFRYEEESFDSGTHISLYTGALYDCANLESVELGTGFTSVYADSFEDCGSLDSITIEEANEPTIYGGATFVTLSDQSGTLVVPSGADYSNWSAALGQDWTVDDSL